MTTMSFTHLFRLIALAVIPTIITSALKYRVPNIDDQYIALATVLSAIIVTIILLPSLKDVVISAMIFFILFYGMWFFDADLMYSLPEELNAYTAVQAGLVQSLIVFFIPFAVSAMVEKRQKSNV